MSGNDEKGKINETIIEVNPLRGETPPTRPLVDIWDRVVAIMILMIFSFVCWSFGCIIISDRILFVFPFDFMYVIYNIGVGVIIGIAFSASLYIICKHYGGGHISMALKYPFVKLKHIYNVARGREVLDGDDDYY